MDRYGDAVEHDERVADIRRKLGKQGWYSGRTRDLAELDKRFVHAGAMIGGSIEERLASGPVRVLEIGFGWGRVLAELALRHRQDPVELHGVNLERKPPVERAEDFAAVAEVFGLLPAQGRSGLPLPTPHFEDATHLHFPDETFDVVYSAVCLRWVEDKAQVLEHVARVLRPGGRALLHLGEANWEYDDGPMTDRRLLTDRPCRMVLHDGNRLVPLDQHLEGRSGDRFTLRMPRGGFCSLVLDKHAAGRLDLRLALDPVGTIPMRDFPHPDRPNGTNGVRSAYLVTG